LCLLWSGGCEDGRVVEFKDPFESEKISCGWYTKTGFRLLTTLLRKNEKGIADVAFA
jgi:hypothetical protein